MTRAKPRFWPRPDAIMIDSPDWLDLGQLRELVRMADDRSWPDDALVSHGVGGQHPFRHDICIAKRLVVEGYDPNRSGA